MSEEEKNQAVPEEDDRARIKTDGEKVSVIENLRRINEKARLDEIKEESRLEAERADRERAARDVYAKKLANDRIELMKLKQGVISEEDMPKEPEAEEKVYTFPEKVGNFIYHNKMYLIIGGLIAALAVFLIYDYVTDKKPDVSVMIIARDSGFITRADDIQTLLEPYCADFNGDGLVYVNVSYLPAIIDDSVDSAELVYAQSEQTKLVAEFQTDETIMVITNDEVTEALGLAGTVFADLRDRYPDNGSVTRLGYMLSGTNLAEDIDFDAMPDNLYVGFRRPIKGGMGINEKTFRTNYENALTLWDNYLSGTKVSEDMPHYSDRRG